MNLRICIQYILTELQHVITELYRFKLVLNAFNNSQNLWNLAFTFETGKCPLKLIKFGLKQIITDKTCKFVNVEALFGCIQDLGWGLLSLFPLFRYFPNFSALPKHTLAIEYLFYICQVSPQLSCSDTSPIKHEYDSKNLTGTFARSNILPMEKLTNGDLVTPIPVLGYRCTIRWLSTVPHNVDGVISNSLFELRSHEIFWHFISWWSLHELSIAQNLF